MLKVSYVDTSKVCWEALSPDSRREILRIVHLIQIDPAPDGKTKTTAWWLGAMYTIYLSRGFWVIYHVDGNHLLVVSFGDSGPYIPMPE